MELGTKLKNTEVNELDQRKTKMAKGRVFKALSSEQQGCVCGDPGDTDDITDDHSV